MNDFLKRIQELQLKTAKDPLTDADAYGPRDASSWKPKDLEFPAGKGYRILLGTWGGERVGISLEDTNLGDRFSIVIDPEDARTLRDWLTDWLGDS